ncbi:MULTISPECIES: DoxX family protein [Streptomyces]|uniref:DoxX family protein n=1 Tax=Streptomyces TaxID=1883 RepID=UPI0006EB6032|nr:MULTISPECIES: DoxX family protein [Streptomyces]
MSVFTDARTTPPGDAASPATSTQSGADLGLLILRWAVGLTMAAHGSQKLFGWFGGGGLDGTAGFFESSGYTAAKAMAVVAALTETLCGLGLVVGLLTPLAGAGIVGVMLNVIAVKWGNGFFGPTGIEYELLLLIAAASLTLAGPGRYAADRLLPVLRTHRLSHGIAAVALGAAAAGIVLVTLRS